MGRIRAALAAAWEGVPTLLWNLTGLAGGGLVAYGAWLIYQPAGFIIGGVLLLVGAILLSPRHA